jgi:VWFA-related protein
MFLMKALPLLLAVSALAQEDAVFRAGVSMVRVDAQVVDGRRVVADLGKEDLVVTDDGQPVPIDYFGRESEPLWLMLLLDVSGSMHRHLQDMSRVAKSALSRLGPEDKVAATYFAGKSRLALTFTGDHGDAAGAIAGALREKSLHAGTSINASLMEAAADMRRAAEGQPGRRAIVVLTDNGGLNYQAPDDKALSALFGADTVVNAIVTPNAKPPQRRVGANPDFTSPDVFLLASQTGGEVLRAEKGGEAFAELLERIRTRYSLHYRPPAGAAPGSVRRIRVDLAPAARRRHPKAEVRARSGYAVPN